VAARRVFVNRRRLTGPNAAALNRSRHSAGRGPMANVTVYFATNRVAQGSTADWRSYGADIVTPTDPSLITYAAAFVEGTDLAKEGSGAIAAISHAQAGGFQPSVAEDIIGSGKNILIFIHGFANSFLNAITR